MWQLNGAWFDFTPHAVRRALDMALDDEQIRECLGNPRYVRPGSAGREMWTRDKLSAVMEARDGFWMVITFTWATANAWVIDRETVQSRSGQIDRDRERSMRYARKMRRKGTSPR